MSASGTERTSRLGWRSAMSGEFNGSMQRHP
jgi:hypothetical protein